jgi:hypothetical protein
MLTKNFHQLQTEVQRHVEADQVEQGSYDTCFIGCLANSKNAPEFIESKYGIPVMLCRIAGAIFEGLSADEAPLFFAAFPAAVKSDGKDLSRVVWQFLAAELRLLPSVEPEVQAIINPVIDGIGLLAEGKEWPEKDAKAAAWAAMAVTRATYWAANAAAKAANEAASAAASAADAASFYYDATTSAARATYWAASAASKAALFGVTGELVVRLATTRRQRDLLLTLIKEAPITQQENN